MPNGLAKNIILGAIFGLIVSIVLQITLSSLFSNYYFRDELIKMYDGGALTAVAMVFLFGWLFKPDEISSMNLWVGLLLILALGISGAIGAMLVLGALSILFSFFGALALIDGIFNLIGGFCVGGVGVGIIGGIWHHIDSPFK